jgi:hypothetical protein
MEITKREIIISIAIVAIMMLFGFMISDSINDAQLDKLQEYNTALKIPDNDTELFQYALDTDVGNAFVEGKLKVVDPVSIDGLDGQYSYISRELEEYTRHTRTVTKTRTNSKGKTETYTETEVYWSWDHRKTDRWESKQINFNGVDFSIDKIEMPGSRHHSTVGCGHHLRYVYHVRDLEWQGTIYAKLKDHTFENVADFCVDADIEQMLEYYTMFNWLWLFWPFWIILTGGLAYGFYYIDNNWLED